MREQIYLFICMFVYSTSVLGDLFIYLLIPSWIFRLPHVAHVMQAAVAGAQVGPKLARSGSRWVKTQPISVELAKVLVELKPRTIKTDQNKIQ